jgi:hypothetical protein
MPHLPDVRKQKRKNTRHLLTLLAPTRTGEMLSIDIGGPFQENTKKRFMALIVDRYSQHHSTQLYDKKPTTAMIITFIKEIINQLQSKGGQILSDTDTVLRSKEY